MDDLASLPEYEVEVHLKVRAANARSAEQFVDGSLAREAFSNSALNVQSINVISPPLDIAWIHGVRRRYHEGKITKDEAMRLLMMEAQ